MMSVPQRAIGVFDSGVGGLTVLKELRRCNPGESLIYLGDTARVPYGTKSPETVLRYAHEAARFLMQKQVKLMVVACNTASAIALEELVRTYDVPVLGVIEPGVTRALQVTRSGRIGVIGTEGTIRSGAYEKDLQSRAADVSVFSVPCPLFVALAEEGWSDHQVARLIAYEYLQPLLQNDIDTLVLGCTHYPLLKKTLQSVVGPEVVLVDSAEETAKAVRLKLASECLLQAASKKHNSSFFVTDISDRFERVGGAFLGERLHDLNTVVLD